VRNMQRINCILESDCASIYCGQLSAIIHGPGVLDTVLLGRLARAGARVRSRECDETDGLRKGLKFTAREGFARLAA
jgi:hypothetical protein